MPPVRRLRTASRTESALLFARQGMEPKPAGRRQTVDIDDRRFAEPGY